MGEADPILPSLASPKPRTLICAPKPLYGGRLSLADGAVVGAQNIVSNGFGASVGLEAAYAQALGHAQIVQIVDETE
jgi:hypothetical protein